MIRSALKLMLLLSIGLLAAEGAVRWWGKSGRLAVNMEYDPVLGYRGPRSTYLAEDYYDMVYGESGFRTFPKHPYRPVNSRPRILFLGDSFTHAWAIQDQDRFTDRLEVNLITQEKGPVDVINLGASDFGTYQELLAWESVGKPFFPDVVAIQFLPLNDFLNNEVSFAHQQKSRLDELRPWWGVPSLSPRRKWWRDHSALFRWIDLTWIMHRPFAESQDCGPELELFLEERRPEWRRALQTTEAILKEFKSSMDRAWREVGETKHLPTAPRLVVVAFPSLVEADESAWKSQLEPRLQHCFPGKAYHRGQGEREIRAITQRLGISYLSLWPTFEAAARKKIQWTISDGHLNEEGHRIAADSMTSHFHTLLQALKRR